MSAGLSIVCTSGPLLNPRDENALTLISVTASNPDTIALVENSFVAPPMAQAGLPPAFSKQVLLTDSKPGVVVL